jgi:vacuolar-type H+-ATPase subunit D/Vma8
MKIHEDALLQHYGVMYRVERIRAPGKRNMAVDQDCRNISRLRVVVFHYGGLNNHQALFTVYAGYIAPGESDQTMLG